MSITKLSCSLKSTDYILVITSTPEYRQSHDPEYMDTNVITYHLISQTTDTVAPDARWITLENLLQIKAVLQLVRHKSGVGGNCILCSRFAAKLYFGEQRYWEILTVRYKNTTYPLWYLLGSNEHNEKFSSWYQGITSHNFKTTNVFQ